ncbi:L,D-transpeptidase [Tianweitania sp. BSSL-BM11]|uniref:L,D-transpeptidase n=1 Tax=Tianweitania aestuarii TaxID=2814886 RepID=A0ABS5S3C9_9HYPH|nr:L,D-transpeptidase [Tianweitania aestuarii]MBS9722427.1 L,D-transpeptidase [Tianweitania aestuarii]
MLRRLLSFVLLATVAGLAPAGAVGMRDDAAHMQPLRSSAGMQLAQAGDVQVFYDEYGRRVLFDTRSGQVIGVEEPTVRNEAPWERDRRQMQRPRYNDDVYSRGGSLRDSPNYIPAPQDGNDPYPLTREEDETYAGRSIERLPLDNGYGEPPAVTGSTSPDVPQSAVPSTPTMSSKASEDMTKLQVLLDRAGASPGVIDGHDGSNVRKALLAYEELTGETLPIGNGPALDAALAATGGPALVDYTITPEDVAAPMVASVPDDYSEKAKLDHLSYTSVTEMFGERFHMDENYLKALNPEANFSRAGTIIRVASIGQNVTAQVDRIVADKARKQVRAYDASGNLVAAYPTTIGSGDTPSPSGTHQVKRIAFDPEYTYNPKLNFQQGQNDKVLRIPPGPNGPVGSIWIALDKPTYGIHGTPEPSKIGKTESHGCVRLTNWDAAELAKIVKPGVFVQFLD